MTWLMLLMTLWCIGGYMRTKEIVETAPMEDLILSKFDDVNKEAVHFVRQWRSGQKQVLDKVNANGTQDVVTDVDMAIESLTRLTFAGTIPVFGEEGFHDDTSVVEKPLYIVVDPIDGTKEFAKGNDEWSISLCAVQNGTPVVASIFMPDKGECFTAIKNKGVRLNGLPLNLQQASNGRIAVSPRQIKDPKFGEYIRRTGLVAAEVSALTPKICALLRGEVQSAVYFPQDGQSAALWDYAAGVLLVQEYGGRISSLCGAELPFRGADIIHKKGWLATRNIDHAYLLACLNSLGEL